MRGTAIGQLAAEMPPAILVATIGITESTAAKWAAIHTGAGIDDAG